MPFKNSVARSVGKLLKTYSEDDLENVRGEDVPYRKDGNGTVEVTILMIGGGGAGGGANTGADGGGGGAGEVKSGTMTLSPGSYVFRAGDGGPGPGNNAGTPGTTGPGTPTFISSPLFTTVTAAGGGAGGQGPDGSSDGAAMPGGSGGGGGGDGTNGPDPTNQPRGSSTAADVSNPYFSLTGYGNPGGHGSEDGGSGGGAGGAGNTQPAGAATPGGAGQAIPAFAYPIIQPSIPSPLQPTFGPAVGPTGLYGGGGAAGGEGQEPSLGGPGGGGGTGNAANPGKEFTGGGGSGYENSTAGGNGGCGVIILRVPTANAPNITVPGSVTDATPGNDYKYFFFPGESTTSYPVSVS